MNKELKKVNIFCGRFQPFHKGHLKACEDAYKKNGYPVFIFYTPNKQFDSRKPFDDKLLEKEYDIIVKNNDFIKGYDWMMFPQPVRMCRVLKEKGYEGVLWLAGEDRIENYKKTLNKISIDKIINELNVNVPELYETNRYGSATEVRNAIKNDDKQKYIELMPKGTEVLYNDFKEQIDRINESNYNLAQYINDNNLNNISLKTYIQESLIIEGGHSIENAQPIRGDLAKVVADEIIKVIKDKFNCECAALGSTGKKTKEQTSGDIDIAIEYDWNNYTDILDFVKEKFNCKIGNINYNLHVFNIGYSYKEDNEEKIVQVDFMFTDDVEFAQFAYNSPDFTKNESKYKGMYQSGLLMAIISNTPVVDILGTKYKEELFNDEYDGKYKGQLKSYWKLYFDQNQGLKAEHKSFEGKTKPLKSASTIKNDTKIITKDINEILVKCLGKSATKETCKTFENELSYIVSDDYKYRSKEQLEKIKETFLNDWQLKMKTSKELMKEFEDLFDEEIKKL